MEQPKIQAVRGMNDLLPEDTARWQRVEEVLRAVPTAYGYREIRLPLVEKTALFCRAIGEVTDVVEKEMYTFTDRSGDSLSLRPEGTAGCVRACLEHHLLHNCEQRLWYLGPMFRHERPQSGRYRQFHQLGVEVFGLPGPAADAEVILLSAAIWERLGLRGRLQLQINNLGAPDERAVYRERLVAFLEAHEADLDEDSRRRTHTNPLRVLDSKDPGVGELLARAPRLADCLGAASREHLARVGEILTACGLDYTVNDRLVRGLDYYNLTVFEWVSTDLGAQATVCGGGRYDGLVAQLGGPPAPAVGFGLGLERLMLILPPPASPAPAADVYVVGDETCLGAVLRTADELRRRLPGRKILTDCAGGAWKRQFRRADRSGARVAAVVGEQEAARNSVTIKDLRDESYPQRECPAAEAAAVIATRLAAGTAEG